MRERPRVVIFATVLTGHAVAIYLLAVSGDVQVYPRSVKLLTFPIRLAPNFPVESPPLPQGEMTRHVPEPAPRLADEAPLPSVISTSSLPEPDPTPGEGVDWAGQAEKRSRNWVEPESAPLKFGSSGQSEDPTQELGRNIFESRSPRRAGFVEMIEPGVERRWLSSRCYREFGKRRDSVADTRPDLNPVTCLMGSGPPRDDLFDHLKPDYLKDAE